MEFARPALRGQGGEGDLEELRALLVVSASVWNAVVITDWGGRDHLSAARDAVQRENPETLELFDRLVNRKRTHFSQARWAITHLEVSAGPAGRLMVHAEARLPG